MSRLCIILPAPGDTGVRGTKLGLSDLMGRPRGARGGLGGAAGVEQRLRDIVNKNSNLEFEEKCIL